MKILTWIEYCGSSMAKSYQKNNLAKARSSWHKKSEELETSYSGESDLDCGYEGGVDCDPSDDEEDFEEDQWSDDESLAELEIRRWEHRMFRWMDAYRAGMGTTDAQKQVKKFSSTKYKSHRRVPETVARTFDQ